VKFEKNLMINDWKERKKERKKEGKFETKYDI